MKLKPKKTIKIKPGIENGININGYFIYSLFESKGIAIIKTNELGGEKKKRKNHIFAGTCGDVVIAEQLVVSSVGDLAEGGWEKAVKKAKEYLETE